MGVPSIQIVPCTAGCKFPNGNTKNGHSGHCNGGLMTTQEARAMDNVTQEDRDAAADWLDAAEDWSTAFCNSVRAGNEDDCETVQAFTRHRQAALATALAEREADRAEMAALTHDLTRSMDTCNEYVNQCAAHEAEIARLTSELRDAYRDAEELAQYPCMTAGPEDMEPGCCATCRARDRAKAGQQ